jgi:hypothetical protein
MRHLTTCLFLCLSTSRTSPLLVYNRMSVILCGTCVLVQEVKIVVTTCLNAEAAWSSGRYFRHRVCHDSCQLIDAVCHVGLFRCS